MHDEEFSVALTKFLKAAGHYGDRDSWVASITGFDERNCRRWLNEGVIPTRATWKLFTGRMRQTCNANLKALEALEHATAVWRSRLRQRSDRAAALHQQQRPTKTERHSSPSVPLIASYDPSAMEALRKPPLPAILDRSDLPGRISVSNLHAPRVFIRKLPRVDPHLFGRGREVAWLERAWSSSETNFAQIIAPGGTGKTALVHRWYRRHASAVPLFGWSFYSQGVRERSQTSSEAFFSEALRWFGIETNPSDSVFANADALVNHLRREKSLLILDGIEPLQDVSGSIRDLALRALLQELAVLNPGLVVVTTRLRIIDVPDSPKSEKQDAVSLDLEDLESEAAVEYLTHLGVIGSDIEKREAAAEFGNHALALTLLGTYLVTFCDGDLNRRIGIRELQIEETGPGQHARKVMASYAMMYRGLPELEILKGLGYFDRPAELDAIRLVLPALPELKYRAALKRLEDARLILPTDDGDALDCHPLVREHFSRESTREGHERLYRHFRNLAIELPTTLEEMIPHFRAIYHGCLAGLHSECRAKIYRDHVLRDTEFYLTQKLGAYGTDLSILANFFDSTWTIASGKLSAEDQRWVLGRTGFVLRALGRMEDAIEPIRISSEQMEAAEDWRNAAINYGHLSSLHLFLGNGDCALEAATQAVTFAEKTDDPSVQSTMYTCLADSVHQFGDASEAEELFKKAEDIQKDAAPSHPWLYGIQGYRYNDLLLTIGRNEEARERASRSLTLDEENGDLIAIGLDHLAIGRSYLAASIESARHLDDAVEFLRRAQRFEFIPLGYIARAHWEDLDRAKRLTTRAKMRLQLVDCHLALVRSMMAKKEQQHALESLEIAYRIAHESKYKRRYVELEDLRSDMGLPTTELGGFDSMVDIL